MQLDLKMNLRNLAWHKEICLILTWHITVALLSIDVLLLAHS